MLACQSGETLGSGSVPGSDWQSCGGGGAVTLPVLASQNAVCSPDPDALMVHHTAKEHKQGSRSEAF